MTKRTSEMCACPPTTTDSMRIWSILYTYILLTKCKYFVECRPRELSNIEMHLTFSGHIYANIQPNTFRMPAITIQEHVLGRTFFFRVYLPPAHPSLHLSLSLSRSLAIFISCTVTLCTLPSPFRQLAQKKRTNNKTK